uniref:Uncharacterized protein n=1 Tax=Tetranychus urticae TaxID=32264 RepID=T1KM19_TETUR
MHFNLLPFPCLITALICIPCEQRMRSETLIQCLSYQCL